jgi:hypothetical protein
MLGHPSKEVLAIMIFFATFTCLHTAYKKPPAIRVVSLGATDVEGDLGWKATFKNSL